MLSYIRKDSLSVTTLSVTASKQRRLPFLPAHQLSWCPETGEIVKSYLLNNTSSVIHCSWFWSVWWLLWVTEVLLVSPCPHPRHGPLHPTGGWGLGLLLPLSCPRTWLAPLPLILCLWKSLCCPLSAPVPCPSAHSVCCWGHTGSAPDPWLWLCAFLSSAVRVWWMTPPDGWLKMTCWEDVGLSRLGGGQYHVRVSSQGVSSLAPGTLPSYLLEVARPYLGSPGPTWGHLMPTCGGHLRF